MANTVVGIFEYESKAQQAQQYLLQNGFDDSNVDIKTASYKSEGEHSDHNRDQDFGDRVGNFFRDLFDGDEEETNRYTEVGRRGTIVTVHTATAVEAESAAAILDEYGAIDVNENSTSYASGREYAAAVTDTPDVTDTYVSDPIVTDSVVPNHHVSDSFVPDSRVSDTAIPDPLLSDDRSSTSLPVIEEDLHVGKSEIETGGIRLRSRIVERPVQESIRLRQESVTVNRTPVDRAASESDFDTFKEGTIELKEYAEIPVVSKEACVVEEVSLNKTVEERDEVINETLRSTEVDVEDLTDEERLRRSGLDL